ncbi:hypothetical protein RHGRI_032995 [Rhododendron griersonianum]|uniref:Protein FAR1-RELATED SEQUENCE n=1 Tax=Rhododendron griersonianum TaxID=479676 RepID=A0AAV6IEI1_9ERIC|nr:hypothetical protein RHGRI_032995 [Rhododendron griersonianum]
MNMENEMIEFDIGLGGGGAGSGDDDAMDSEQHHVIDEEMADSSPTGGGGGAIYIPEGDPDLEPYEGMEFESEEAAKAFYNSYGRRVGFSTRVSSSRRSRKDGAIIQRSFVCAKEGFRNLNEKRTKDREIKRPRIITRCGCKASLSVKIQEPSGKWVVSGLVKEHNHELVPPDEVHRLRSHRQISGPAKTLIDTLQAAGMGPRRIMSALIKEYGGASKVGFTELFARFQEELVGTLTFMASKVEDDGEVTTYQVAKFGEDHKAYYVKFNVLEMRATCSCQMFEFSGLLCRHVLAIFRVTNVLTLPSHYILKRWTRNAKSSIILEERGGSGVVSSYLESHTVRFNTLRHEAFKFVEEGAESIDSYNVAIVALKQAAKRVAVSTKNEGKTPMTNGRVRENVTNGGSQANNSVGNHPRSVSGQLSEDDMDRKIQDLTHEVDCANRKCEVYRANLLSVLRDIEDHKQQLSVKVQNIKLSMKDGL